MGPFFIFFVTDGVAAYPKITNRKKIDKQYNLTFLVIATKVVSSAVYEYK